MLLACAMLIAADGSLTARGGCRLITRGLLAYLTGGGCARARTAAAGAAEDMSPGGGDSRPVEGAVEATERVEPTAGFTLDAGRDTRGFGTATAETAASARTRPPAVGAEAFSVMFADEDASLLVTASAADWT